jgi:hypothetical protein
LNVEKQALEKEWASLGVQSMLSISLFSWAARVYGNVCRKFTIQREEEHGRSCLADV